MDASSDFMSDWQAIYARVTTQTTKDQEKYRKACQRYAATFNIDPFLQGCHQIDIIIVVTALSARLRQGYYGKGVQIKVPTVNKALLTITMSVHLVGNPVPSKRCKTTKSSPSSA